MSYEYKFVPAPSRGDKRRGVKTPEHRFAATLEDAVNALAADGWEYLRTDTLPSEERSGLRQTATVWRTMLVFRRAAMAQTGRAPDAGNTTPEPALSARGTLRAVPAEGAGVRSEGLPRFSARREDSTIAEPVRRLFATRDAAGPPQDARPDASGPPRDDD